MYVPQNRIYSTYKYDELVNTIPRLIAKNMKTNNIKLPKI